MQPIAAISCVSSIMVKLVIFVVFFAAVPAFAGELRDDECQRWQDARRAPARIGVNDFTRELAESALRTLNTISLKDAETVSSNREMVKRETANLLGYLLRAELLNARANNEHDGDELNDFCRHWSMVNFGTPDYKRSN